MGKGNKDKINIKIIVGSTRDGRFSDKPTKWILKEANKLKDVEAEILDLRDYKIPFLNSSILPSMANRNYKNRKIQKWSKKIDEGDAFIIVTPEYNHGYPAVLKNALDVIYPEWNKKPVGFVSYGGAMGVRSVEQLRQVVIALQMIPIKNAIHIPNEIFFSLSNESRYKEDIFQSLRKPQNDPVERFFNELLWLAKKLKEERKLHKK